MAVDPIEEIQRLLKEQERDVKILCSEVRQLAIQRDMWRSISISCIISMLILLAALILTGLNII